MKKILLFLIVLCSMTSLMAQTQTSATYSAGDIPTQDLVYSAACNGPLTTLVVTIPAGDFVFSVDVAYDMTAASGAWMSEQRSQIYCQDTGLDEGGDISGINGNSAGIESYSRSGLTLANGVDADGILTFEMRAWRSWAGAAGCSTIYNKVDDGTWTVTVNHGPPPTCSPPSAGTVSNNIGSAVDFSFTENGTATAWDIEIVPAGTAPTGFPTAGYDDTTNPVTISGLMGVTDYEIYYRADCGMDNTTDASNWSGPIAFTTVCTPFVPDYLEDFTNYDFAYPLNIACWDEADNQDLATGPAVPGGANWGSDNFGNIAGSSNCAKINLFTTGNNDWLLSPLFDLTVGGYQAEFDFSITGFGVTLDTILGSDDEVHFLVTTDGSTWSPLQIWTFDDNVNPAGEHMVYDLSPYDGLAGVQFAFFGTDGTVDDANDVDVFVDNFQVRTVPTCNDLVSASTSNIMPTTVDFSWVTTGSEPTWDIELVAAGAAPTGVPTDNDVTTTTFEVSGLTPATDYDLYVRADCGSDDSNVSVWLGPISFTSACIAFNLPYLEDMENAGGIPNCWTNSAADNFDWSFGTATGSSGTGPQNGDHTSGTGFFAYIETSGAPVGNVATLVSPEIDISSLTVPYLSFWYDMFGAQIGTLDVEVSTDGVTWVNVFTLTGDQGSGWTEGNADLSAYAGGSLYVQFIATTNGGYQGDISIDDFTIIEAPSCLPVTSPLTSNITTNSVDVAWTAGGPEPTWDVEVVTSGTAPTGTPTANDVMTNPYTVTGLMPATNYDIYLRADCGSDDTNVSVWVGPITITTACATFTLPYLEAMENGGAVPNCWENDATDDFDWSFGTATGSTGTGPQNGDHTTGTGLFAYIETSGAPVGNVAILNSPAIDVSSLTVPSLSFWYDMLGAQIGTLDVEASSDGTTWTNVFSLTGDQGGGWVEAIADLSAYAGGDVYIRFIATTNGSYQGDISIDDVTFVEAPSCLGVTGLIAANVTTDGADISWTAAGTATAWDIEVVPSGTAPTGTPTQNDVMTNPFTLTGLMDATTYDVYVRSDCGMDDTDVSTNWTGPISFQTLCLPVNANATTAACDDFSTSLDCWSQSGTDNWLYDANGYVEAPFWNMTGGETATLQSPSIIIDAGMNPELKFDWSHLYNATYPGDSLAVNISSDNGATWTTLFMAGGANLDSQDGATNNAAGTFVTETFDISAFAGMTVVIELAATSGFGPDLFVDNVCVEEAPTPCLAPTALAAANVTETTADLSWTAGNAETVWSVEYGPAGFTQGSGTVVSTLTNPAHTLSGLTGGTAYEYYACSDCGALSTNLVITGAYDGPLSGGTPKGVELYAVDDIADLSTYGLGSANNGGGTDGEEFTFPAVAVTAGTFIYVASEDPQFTTFFGFAPDYFTGAMSINGDDAVELFNGGVVVDVFGDINTDGSGEAWDFLDGWAYRNPMMGPNGGTFDANNWSYSGINSFDPAADNATAPSPFPLGTYAPAALPAVTTVCAGPFAFTTVVPCLTDGGMISTMDSTIICVDGVGDPINVTLTGNVGTNSQYVITDPNGMILDLPMGAGPFDLDGAGPGTCLIWHLSFEPGLMGAAVGMNANTDLVGCYDLSNPITVQRLEPMGGTITTTDSTTICVDGMADPIAVTLTGNIGGNSQFVITDQAGLILDLPMGAGPFDLDGAGPGVCVLWHLSYEDGLMGAAVGMNATTDLVGCYSLSNPITITRLEPMGGTITTTDSTTICVDGTGDPIAVTLTGEQGGNSQFVITDQAGLILDLPMGAGPFDLDGAGPGVCVLWHLSYEDGLMGAAVGMNATTDLVGCYSLSNPITITRLEPMGGTITTTDSTTICVDGMGDPIAVTLTGEQGGNSQFVITDQAGLILDLPMGAGPFDLDGAGPGVCVLWHLSYEDGLMGAAVGMNATTDLVGCYSLSNPITITRLEPMGGTITTTDSTTICVDGTGDPIAVTLTGEQGGNSQFVITDQAGLILDLPMGAGPFDLDGAGPGVCVLWHLSYEDGLMGAAVGMNATTDLVGCYSLSNPITITRLEPMGGTIVTNDPTTICVDGTPDPINVTLTGEQGGNSQFVITDQAGLILDLPMGAGPFDLDGAGPGICVIWHLSYEDGLMGAAVGANANTDLVGCYSLSNPITVTRNESYDLVETYSGCSGDGYSVDVNGTTYDEANPIGMETMTSTTGCDSIVTIDLSFSPAIVIAVDDVVGSTGSDGSVDITVTGGTAPYTFAWTGGSTDEDPSGLAPGDYSVTVTDANGCTFEAGPIDVFDAVNTTDIEELTSFSLMPNPARDYVNVQVEFTESKDFSLQIINAVGQTLSNQYYNGITQSTIELDTRNLASGIYFVRLVSNNKEQAIERLVITK